MDDAVRILAEMNDQAWALLEGAVGDLGADEIDWRPLPEANSINVIVRHLRIEAQWHLDSLERGEEMPAQATADLQKQIDAIPLDFECNLRELERLYAAFRESLRSALLQDLLERTAAAYRSAPAPVPAHLLGYHQALHIVAHCGQIRAIRNLYRKTRGEPARFFPENPTYRR